jgi:GNAT superfamily N-acetyltransferase
MTALTLRAPRDTDADAIAELLAQLGYPATAEEVRARLQRMLKDPHVVVFVAEVDGVVAGLSTGHAIQSIHHTPPTVLLTTLVVDESRRGGGVGRALTRAIEAWARSRGATRISLTSGAQRADAHAFYERLGYQRTGVRLTRTLG